MHNFEGGDYSDIAIEIIQNYEKLQRNNKDCKNYKYQESCLNQRNMSSSYKSELSEDLFFEKKKFLNPSYVKDGGNESSAHRSITLGGKKRNAHEKEKEKEKGIEEFHDEDSYDSLVEDFYVETIRRRDEVSKRKDGSESESESENERKGENKESSSAKKNNEKKLLLKKKMIQRNRDILKKNINKPLMPLLKKKNPQNAQKNKMKYGKKDPPKLIQVKHQHEWNSCQTDMNKYKLTEEELEEKRRSLRSKNIEKARMECKNRLKYSEGKRKSVATDVMNISNSKNGAVNTNIILMNKKREAYRQIENQQDFLNKRKQSHLKKEVSKKKDIGKKKETERDRLKGGNKDRQKNMGNEFETETETETESEYEYESECEVGFEDDADLEIYKGRPTNRRRKLTSMQRNGRTKLNKLKERERKHWHEKNRYAFEDISETIINRSCDDSGFYIYENSEEEEEEEESVVSSEGGSLYDSVIPYNKKNTLKNNLMSTNKRTLPKLRNSSIAINVEKEENTKISKNEDMSTCTENDFFSDELTIDSNFVEQLKNCNENLSIDIDVANIKTKIDISRIEKKEFNEREYFPNINHINEFYENSGFDNSFHDYYNVEKEWEDVFSSDYSSQTDRIGYFNENDNLLKLKKNKVETFKNIKNIMKGLKYWKNEEGRETKEKKHRSVVEEKEDTTEHAKVRNEVKKYPASNKIVHDKEKTLMVDTTIENVEKQKIFPLIDLLFKEDEDEDEEENENENENEIEGDETGRRGMGMTQMKTASTEFFEKEKRKFINEIENQKMDFSDFEKKSKELTNVSLKTSLQFNNSKSRDSNGLNFFRINDQFSPSSNCYSEARTFPNFSSFSILDQISRVSSSNQKESCASAENSLEKETKDMDKSDKTEKLNHEEIYKWSNLKESQDVNVAAHDDADVDFDDDFDFVAREICRTPKEHNDKNLTSVLTSCEQGKSNANLKNSENTEESLNTLLKHLNFSEMTSEGEVKETVAKQRLPNNKSYDTYSGKESLLHFSNETSKYKEKEFFMEPSLVQDKDMGKSQTKNKNSQKIQSKVRNDLKNDDKKWGKGKIEVKGKRVEKGKTTHFVANEKTNAKTILKKMDNFDKNCVSNLQEKKSKEKKNIKESREHTEKKKDDEATKNCNFKLKSKNATYSGETNIQKKSHLVSNSHNKRASAKIMKKKSQHKGGGGISSNKEDRIINQKILNTSIDLEDINNLSDDDKFIFDTYLNNGSDEEKQRKEGNANNEDLSEIINQQVKAFEQAFL